MNHSSATRKYLTLAFTAFIILVVLGLVFSFAKKGDTGMNLLAISLLLCGILCAFIFMGCICTWVYKDCALRGENGLLWAIIVIAASPFVGLILYFISRKEEKGSCKGCGKRISKNANYCEHCGVKNEIQEGFFMTKTNKNMKLIVAAVTAIVIMIGCFATFTVLAFTSDGFIDTTVWNTGIVTMSYENKFGNKWDLNFKSASDGYRKRNTFKIKEGDEILYAEITCGEGELLLHIEQDNKQETIDVSNLDEPLEYPLEGFEPGKVTVILEIHGAKNVKSQITVK